MLRGVVEAEANQVRAFAGREAALAGGNASQAGGITSSERDSVAQAEAGLLDDVLDGAIHSQGGAGQARTASETHAAVGVEFDV